MKLYFNAILTLFLAGASLGGAARVHGDMGGFQTLRLLNGDLMHGQVLDARGTDLEFQPRWTQSPVRIGLRFVNYLLLNSEASAHFTPKGWIELTNEDRLEGRFLGMDAEWIHWETPWGQKVNARRRMVKTLGFYPQEGEVLLPFVNSMAEWELMDHGRRQGHTQNITMIGGEIILPAGNTVTVARQMPKIPEQFLFEFKLQNSEEPYSSAITLMGLPAHGRAPGSMYLQVNQRHVFAQLISAQNRGGNNWREDLPPHAQSEQFFQIFVDLNAETALVYLNGRRFKEWEISNEDALVGREDLVFSFRPVQGSGRARLSRVRMLQWDGKTTPQDLGAADRQKDAIFLRNGDMLEGRVVQADGRNLTVEVEAGGSRTFPLADVIEYHPPVPLRATPRRRNRDVEVRLHGNGNRLVYTLTGFDGENWIGEGGAWSAPLEIPHEWLAFVRYNIYRRDTGEAAEISIDLERSFLDSVK
ncbi:MAG: hypothetical protein JJU29_14730 [Verrucomicrobia bacterium]|nr:hypothetical protein [Verrucomicrobiota bacterium]MCH8513229.1 hypothetical protein [Kiritimatiellia bacterium]